MSRSSRSGSRLDWDEVRRLASQVDASETPQRAELADATRSLVAKLASDHPGRLIEFRVPPFAAAQLGDGTGGVHTRGTPPNVVETDALTLLGLATGRLSWRDAVVSGQLRASGVRSDLSDWFPMVAADDTFLEG